MSAAICEAIAPDADTSEAGPHRVRCLWVDGERGGWIYCSMPAVATAPGRSPVFCTTHIEVGFTHRVRA